MSGEVEISRGVTRRDASGVVDFAAPGMTQQLFGTLEVCHDLTPHSAPINMAIDEALLDSAAVTTIRFYRWLSPALSFGYFGKFSDVANYAAERDLVRRWTGGGIVLHGDDLTYSIVIPASDPIFDQSSTAIYEKIHRALANALNGFGEHAVVARAVVARGVSEYGTVIGGGYHCFANPVRADVIIDGRKVAGAAQRRTRRGLLQQGSIQGFTIDTDLAQKFARCLSVNCREFTIHEGISERAMELARQKYGSDSWLRKR
jgi:lipoyl(octanoyl) transferase